MPDATDPLLALHGLVEVTRLMRAQTPLDELLVGAAEAISWSLGFRTVAVNLYRPADADFEVTTVVGDPRAAQALLGTTVSAEYWQSVLDPRFDEDGVYFVREGEVEWTERDGPFYIAPELRAEAPGSAEHWHAEDALMAPMRSAGGELLGVVSVDDPLSGRRPDQITRQALAAVANHTGLAIEQRQSDARAAAHTTALEELFAVATRIAETLEPVPALHMICAAVRDVLGFQDVALALRRGEGDLVSVDAGADAFALSARELKRLLTAAEDHAGVYLLGPEDAAALWPGPLPAPAPGAGPFAFGGHLLLVPLRDAGGEIAGLLRIAGPSDRLLPDRDGLATLRMFAVQAAATLDSAAQRALREQRDRALHLASHDTLTGLPNRAVLRSGLAARLGAGTESWVLFLDLDDFKIVNDALGHHDGDEVLEGVGARLRGAAAGHLVCRLGGDEFALLVDGDEPVARRVADAIHEALATPFDIAGVEYRVGASIGIAAAAPPLTVSEVLKRADIAMYQSKSRGGGLTSVYDPETDDAASRLATIAALRGAVVRGELELHYQPIVLAADERLVQLEALLRWRVDGRLVPPLEFIPLAEASGLIEPIGAWVVAEAARQSRAWRDAGLVVPPIAVNISPHQLRRGDLAATFAAALARHGLPADALTAEITESALLPDPHVSAELEALRGTGVRCAIDDFGAAYSSLGRLLELPVDQLKVDRAFLRAVPDSPRAIGLLQAVVALAGAVHLDVVVEGVETAAQHAVLRAYGDTAIACQGFLFARPLPAAELQPLLATAA